MIEIPGYYELLGKVNHWKEKYEKDTSKMKSQIKKQIDRLEVLKEKIKTIESTDYYYQLWLKEREELIKKAKENNKLLEDIITLKEKLSNEIIRNVAEKDVYKKIIDSKYKINWLTINKNCSRLLEILKEPALERFQELKKKTSEGIISTIEMVESLALQLVIDPYFDNEIKIIDNSNHLLEFNKTKKKG